MQAAGCYDVALEWLSPQPSSMALGGQLLESELASHPDVDAIFFCNDDLAQGGLLAALRLGIPVPQQVAIAGFNDLAGSDQMWPPPYHHTHPSRGNRRKRRSHAAGADARRGAGAVQH